MRGMACSIALHAFAVAWLLSSAIPAEMMPQQMIHVTLVAAPSAEPDQQKPLPAKQAPQKQEIKKSEPQNQPVIRQESATAMHKAEEPPKPSPAEMQQLSAPNAAVAKPVAATETAQMVTTKPLFDAAYLRNPAPDYPAHAKRRRMEGIVMLDVLVKQDGLPQSVSIAESSGFAVLDESAKNAVSRWKFVPAKRDGETVEARVMVPIEFRLE